MLILKTLLTAAPRAWTLAEAAAAWRYVGLMVLVFGAMAFGDWIFAHHRRREQENEHARARHRYQTHGVRLHTDNPGR
jgi:hypothetical protein